MKSYKTIFLDLDDTLFDYTGDEKRAIAKVLSAHGMLVDDDVFEFYYSIDDWQIFSMGNITPNSIISDHFRRLLKYFEVSDENIAKWGDEFYDVMINSHRLKYGAKKMLDYLKEKKYKLYITSNGHSEFQRKRIKDSGIEGYFNGIFISEEMDLRKPSKSYFDYVMARIPESNRKNVLLIGDAPTTDVLAGINSGIDVCWLNDKKRKCRYKYTYQIKGLKDLTKIL